MREVDPTTQCERIVKPIMPAMMASMMMYYTCVYQMAGLMDMPKRPKESRLKPWDEINLSKKERKELDYEDKQELKRYYWTLKTMDYRRWWR